MIGFIDTSIINTISYDSSQSMTVYDSPICWILSLSLSLMLRPTVSRPVCLGVKHPSGAYDQIFINVRQLRVCWCEALSLSLWREDWSVVYSCCWCSSGQSFSGPSPVGLVTIFYFLRFETSLSVASCGSQGFGGGIRPRLHMGFSRMLSLSSESYVTADGQSASLSWNKAPIWGLRPDFYYCQTVAGLLMWGALSDERTSLSFTIPAGPRIHEWTFL
jgi:hypothetical protein